MPAIFELFGYPLADQTPEAARHREAAQCPFMGRDCDGGGNRELSRVDLSRNIELREAFSLYQGTKVAVGVCSIQVSPNDSPWIVCPRRLLSLGRQAAGMRRYQAQTERTLLGLLGYPAGTRLGIWPEVKLKLIRQQDDELKSIDYSFDYVLMPVGRVSLENIAQLFPGASPRKLRGTLARGGYAMSAEAGTTYVDNFPIGIPSIIEIMTSSTSGGNKDKRSTIVAAFEDAMLGRPHQAPGINYRQVWARMVSQLIVKSEFAMGWGGKTIWVVQDKLLEYINATTALTLSNFLSDSTSDVNMLSFSYSDLHHALLGVLDLSDNKLYAGKISSVPEDVAQALPPSIQDITRAPFQPSLATLVGLLAAKPPINEVLVL